MSPAPLLQVTLHFTPSNQLSRTLITASDMVVTFTRINQPLMPLGQLRIIDTATTIDLVFCPADDNGNFIDSSTSSPPPNPKPPANSNNTRAIDFIDDPALIASIAKNC